MSRNVEMYQADDIVISGASGVFPDCENIEEFKQNLLSGKDMVAFTNRTNANMRTGLIKTIDRFDYTFFHVTRQQAEKMTIASRMLLEKTFEAIIDAGYNPEEMKGKNIAVACGIWDHSDKDDPSWEDAHESYESFTRCQFMASNRISNWLDIHGPSFSINTACSSAMYALDTAIKFIQSGKCDGAIVCAPNFCFSMTEITLDSPVHTHKLKSAPFDADANGYTRSEAVVVLFLQKRKDARRVYANVIHSATNCDGFKKEGITYPSVEQQKQLYDMFYKSINMDPRLVSYIEAHGTATQAGDIVEGISIEEFFCKDRENPLKIGTVKSNMGHSEAASALCGIVKLIISFETGVIPANLHYTNPNPKIKGLLNGKLEIVREPTPLEGEYFATSSFGIGGANGHILLTPYNKVKKSTPSWDQIIPQIVTVSGRTEQAVDVLLDEIEKHNTDVEYVALMHKIFSSDISGHLHRGYIILSKHKELQSTKSKAIHSGEKRPIWFVFSGMGSQWPTMGKSLMNIPVFAESIQRSHHVLKTKEIDLIRIITEDDEQIFKNILNSLIGIAAIQIALVDILKALQIEPDGLIGHSLGELGCAYADGCLTAEQTILAAYYRGLACIENILIHGTMAAVGEGYNTIKHIVPEGIDVACHNSSTSCTISGPAEMMKNFIEQLNRKKIFVREVNTSNIAFHGRYITPVAKPLLAYMKQIIPEPKLRSDKWICTSAPESLWNTNQVKYSGAEYHVNNLLNTVYFEEGCSRIPSNAIAIEIAPHGLLKAILDRSLPATVQNIPLAMKNHDNGVDFLLNAVGRIYEAGCTPQLSNLYPTIEFPVSRSTPMISPLIKWQHDEQWPMGKLDNEITSAERIFVMKTTDEKSKFLTDHIIDGRNLYPGFGYLWLVLESFSMIKKKKITEIPVVFENVYFERVTTIPEKKSLKFQVIIHTTTNNFEVTEDNATVTRGKIRTMEAHEQKLLNETPIQNTSSIEEFDFMNTKDFYKELKIRGYGYKGLFKQVASVNCEGTYAEIWWHDNFIAFMDAMTQVRFLQYHSRELRIPTYAHRISIDFNKHFATLKTLDNENPKFAMTFYPNYDMLVSGGIQIEGQTHMEIARRKTEADPILEKYQFVPYISNEEMELDQVVRLCVHIAVENTPSIQIKTYEIFENEHPQEVPCISRAINDSLRDLPSLQADINILMNSECPFATEELNGIKISDDELPKDKSSFLIVLTNLRNKINILEDIFKTLKKGGFIITKESIICNDSFEDLGLNVCFSRAINTKEKILLLNKISKTKSTYRLSKILSDSYSWVSTLKKELSSINLKSHEKLVVYAEKDPLSGILGLFNCLRKEEKGIATRCIFMMDNNASDVSLGNPFIITQLEKNLSHNVYKDKTWGSYRQLKLEPIKNISANNALCILEDRGNLSSFKWIESSLNPRKHDDFQGSLAYVYYSGLNFRDSMLSTGKTSPMETTGYNYFKQSHQGHEYSGRDKHGVRIMGITNDGGIATIIKTLPNFTWVVPDNMTMEEAATIPVVYSTVIYAFFFKMNLQRGSSVLIHAGSGDIGQAAINICLHFNCIIFTTVETKEKVEFIRKTFPEIPEHNIGNSRDPFFHKLVMDRTNGRGVDVVLNSLSEEKFKISLRCVAKGGHFLEVGKFDMAENNSLEMGHFLNDISFHSVQLDVSNESENASRIHDKLTELLYNEGAIKPIQRTIFQPDQVETAFRSMTAGKNIGKILIKILDEEKDLKAKPSSVEMTIQPSIYCKDTESYVIVGGLGGFGLELADWLILRGARNIVLSSRAGISNGYQTSRTKLWRLYGVKVVISTEDTTKENGVRKILQTANSLGAVAAIFNLAAILMDGPFLQQNEENFNIVAEPKVKATIHLDKLSRVMCPHLEHFVVFSSVSCGLGNINQTTYAYANSVMERICETRRRDNLPALAIQWGAIGDVGIVAELVEDNIDGVLGGTLQQSIKSCLNALNIFMNQPNSVVSSMIVANKHQGCSDIISTVANVLGIKKIKTINLTWTLPELGMDSLLALELKQILDVEFGVSFSTEQLRMMTFAKLYAIQAEKGKKSIQDKKPKTQLQFFLDEKLLTKPILRLPFDENNTEASFSINEHPTVFLFPGIEGIAISMDQMAKNLPLQVSCFQYYFQESTDFSFNKLHHHFVNYILDNLEPNRKFHLIGHSLGGLVAMQVADILEKNGRKGHLCLIDTSPLLFGALATEHERNTSNEGLLENEVCKYLIQSLIPEVAFEDLELVEKAKDWESRKARCLAALSALPITQGVLHQLLDKMLVIFKAASKHEIPHNISLESQCVLIRSVENKFNLDECYGLSKYFKKPVRVYKIDEDHFSIISHPKTSEIIMGSTAWEKE